MLEAEVVMNKFMDDLNNDKLKKDIEPSIEGENLTDSIVKKHIQEYRNLLNDSVMLNIMNETVFDEIPKCKVCVKK